MSRLATARIGAQVERRDSEDVVEPRASSSAVGRSRQDRCGLSRALEDPKRRFDHHWTDSSIRRGGTN